MRFLICVRLQFNNIVISWLTSRMTMIASLSMSLKRSLSCFIDSITKYTLKQVLTFSNSLCQHHCIVTTCLRDFRTTLSYLKH